MSGAGPAGAGAAGAGAGGGAGASTDPNANLIGIGNILDLGRELMAVMQPCTGTRASGDVTCKALSGKTIQIPRNHYAFPIIKGDRRPELVFKVAKNPDTADGSWEVDDSGADVLMISNIGGVRYNLPAGTRIAFDPPIADLVGSPNGDQPKVKATFTGGADAAGLAAVADMAMYEKLRGGELAHDLRRSSIIGFPAVILTWSDLQSADGVTVPQGDRGNRVGTRSTLYKSSWDITILVSRENEDHERRHAGLAITDYLTRLLTDRQSVDGQCISNPSGLQVLQVFRETAIPQAVYQKFYIYHIIVAAEIGVEQIDSRSYEDWITAVISVDKPQSPALPNQGSFTLVDDMEVDMS